MHSCSCDNSAPTESHQFVRSCTRNVAARTKLMEVVCKEDAPDGTHLRKGHAIQPTFSCFCFKFGQVIVLHTMSSPQFLFQAHKYRLQAHLYQRVRSVQSALANQCGSVPFPTEAVQSIQRVRSMARHTVSKYAAGIVHISTQLGNSTRLTFHEGKRRRPRRRTLPRRAHRCCHKAPPLEIPIGARCQTALWAVILRAHELTKLPPPLAGRAMRKQVV